MKKLLINTIRLRSCKKKITNYFVNCFFIFIFELFINFKLLIMKKILVLFVVVLGFMSFNSNSVNYEMESLTDVDIKTSVDSQHKPFYEKSMIWRCTATLYFNGRVMGVFSAEGLSISEACAKATKLANDYRAMITLNPLPPFSWHLTF